MTVSDAIDELSRVTLFDLSRRRRDSLSPEELSCLERQTIKRLPASSEEIRAAEHRLAVELPSDHVEFLRCANGVLLPEVAGHARWMLPIAEVARVDVLCPDVVTFLEEFGSGRNFVPLSVMPEAGNVMHDEQPDLNLLRKALVIVDPGGPSDGVFLTPFPQFGSRAWEFWLLDPHSGCIRFRRIDDLLAFQSSRHE